MSLNRTALRLATVLALSNNFTAPHPTIAEARVYDSKLDPIEGHDPEDLVPIIVVYTDDDNGSALSENNGGPQYRRSVQLMIELSIGIIKQSDTGQTVSLPETEPELEAMLDLFEHQVRFALADLTSRWTILWHDMAKRTRSWSSQRHASSEGSVRWAARQITAQVEIEDDCTPEIATATPDPAPIPQHIVALLAAVDADRDEDGNPKGHVKPLIDLLKQAGVPHTLTLDALKSIHMVELTPDANDKGVRFSAENLDD